MTRIWWGKESRPPRGVRLTASRGTPYAQQPELLSALRKEIQDEVRARVRSYTPEWTNLRPTDAGMTLVKLFGEQIEPVIQRLNLLPKKSFIEFLSLAGVSALPATPAEAMLEFTVSNGAKQSVLVGRGFQVGARPATGQGDMVIFETKFNLMAAPAKIKARFAKEGSLFSEVAEENFRPFGERPITGRSFYIGLSGDVAPSSFLSLGIGIAAVAGAPPPVPSGGVAPLPVPSPPLLEWDVLDGSSFQPAEIVRDETGGLFRSGVVELRLPRQWRKGKIEGMGDEEELRWLRLRIVFGQYKASPQLSFIRLNMTRAVAARTIRNEVLQDVPNSNRRQMRLSQTPVIQGSLILIVDDGGFASVIDNETSAAQDQQTESTSAQQNAGADAIDSTPNDIPGRRWKEVESLLDYGPEAEVFVLDGAKGIVHFGDNRHGAAVPPGFRNVRAASYSVGGGAAGAVEADAIKIMLSSAPFITGVTNPLPASGGTDTESQQRAMNRGPQEFRARGRAVTVADYALLAMRAPGAQVARTHAVSGHHPAYPGRPIPGVVGVYVVPPDRNEGPPTPDAGTLRAVAEQLSKALAPSGVEVVAAAPRYHKIRAEVSVVVDPTADTSDTVRRVLAELDTYLHPLTGGENGEGWPFGGTLVYTVLVRRLLANVRGVLAVPRLNLVVDGIRNGVCTDYTPTPHSLFWPEGHEVIALEPEGES
jgi:hypothetical protein